MYPVYDSFDEAKASGAAATGLRSSVDARLSAYPGQTGLRLIQANLEAFALRAASARQAQVSLDLQYYYWRNDLTGKLLLREVILAADRGARVRLLLDDFNTGGRDRILRLLTCHPNIEVRLFNPSRSRDSRWRRNIELVLNAWTATRRMHNKAWIVDGAVAIVGGRNIGDSYFDACPDTHFVDLDLLAVGPAVKDAADIFERYWTSNAVVSRRPFGGRPRLALLRRALERAYRSEPAQRYVAAAEQLAGRLDWLHDHRMAFMPEARVIADPPEKASGAGERHWIAETLFAALGKASRTVHLTSPYFIPGDDGVAALSGMRARGVHIAVLTNSLASTDVAAVHGAYAKYRAPLLRAGIELYELRATPSAPDDLSVFGSSTGKLHTKAFTIDGESGFVGSFNFDPRSRSINTEMGILFTHAGLAAEIDRIFAGELSPKSSYRLGLDGSTLVWNGDEGKAPAFEPGASLKRRVIARITGWLPFETQL